MTSLIVPPPPCGDSGPVDLSVFRLTSRTSPGKNDAQPITDGSNVDFLPVWKAGATPYERLMEVAAIAMKHPERFDRMIIAYTEDSGTGTKTRYACNNLTTLELFGLIELLKQEVWLTVKGS